MNNIFFKLYGYVVQIQDTYENFIKPLPNKDAMVNISKNINNLTNVIKIIKNINTFNLEKIDNLNLIETCKDLDMQRLAIDETNFVNNKILLLAKNLENILNNSNKRKFEDKVVNNLILEIRAGTGGDEAGIFAYELLQMYLKFADKKKWSHKTINYSSLHRKSIKEVIVSIKGPNIYKYLKQENGVHRVQRIPETESQGRIHTSTCSVVVMPEEDIKSILIHEKDIRIDVFRSSGPGGQSVNTTDSAVRILHMPTGIMVQCQNEKSQTRNKITALNILKMKIQKYYNSKKELENLQARRSIIGSSERSEKIRTYNFPHDRCTDHKTGVTMQNLNKLLSGNLDDFIYKTNNLKNSMQ